jgi:hypothetical protein
VGTAPPSGQPPTESIRPGNAVAGLSMHLRTVLTSRPGDRTITFPWRTCHCPPHRSVKPLVRLPRLSRLVTAYGRNRPLGLEVKSYPPSGTTPGYPQPSTEAGTKAGRDGWMGRNVPHADKDLGPVITNNTIELDTMIAVSRLLSYAAVRALRTSIQVEQDGDPFAQH